MYELYPILKRVKQELGYESPIQASKITKYGKHWAVSTPDLFIQDVKLSSDEGKEFKKYIKDTI